MLQYSFGLEREAQAIETAVANVIEDNRTWDIMEKGMTEVGTDLMGTLIAAQVQKE